MSLAGTAGREGGSGKGLFLSGVRTLRSSAGWNSVGTSAHDPWGSGLDRGA